MSSLAYNDDLPENYEGNLVGTSLCYCVKSIVEKNIPLDRIDYIITSTAMQNEDDLEAVIRTYSKSTWLEADERCAPIARQLWKAGKLYQPRLSIGRSPGGKNKFVIWHTESDGAVILRSMM